MKVLCEDIQSKLAEGGMQLLNAVEQQHAHSCTECLQFLEDLVDLDAGLKSLTDYDAPHSVVQSLMAKVAAEPVPLRRRPMSERIRWGFVGVGALSVLGVVAVAIQGITRTERAPDQFYSESRIASTVNAMLTYIEGSFGALVMVSFMLAALMASFARRFKMAGGFVTIALCAFTLRSFTATFFNDQNISEGSGRLVTRYNDKRIGSSVAARPDSLDPEAHYYRGVAPQPKPEEADAFAESEKYGDLVAQFNRGIDGLRGDEQARINSLGKSSKASEYNERTAQIFKKILDRIEEQNKDASKLKSIKGDGDAASGTLAGQMAELNSIVISVPRGFATDPLQGSRVDLYVREPGLVSSAPSLIAKDVRVISAKTEDISDDGSTVLVRLTVELPQSVNQFLALSRGKVELIIQSGGAAGLDGLARETPAPEAEKHSAVVPLPGSFDALSGFWASRPVSAIRKFHPSSGYWANTYIPGDPAFLHLYAQASATDLSLLEEYLPPNLRGADNFDRAARPIVQPFDVPRGAALSIDLQSDRPYLAEPGRMLVQVGIKATHRQSAMRPAMNVALVLDLRGADANFADFEALTWALEKARLPGDRMSLIVIGKSGRVLIKPGEFRHGTVLIALKKLSGSVARDGDVFGLEEGMNEAVSLVHSDADSNAALGSNLIIFATAQPLQADAERIAVIARQSAVAGIPVSAVAVGGHAVQHELDAIVLAGQGNRRILSHRADAETLVERELSSISTVVARAIRLRIRLAPGVQLVDVVGSRRLNQIQSVQVKAAERSIDIRLSKTFGIQADRGADEEGIQIVIPAFYSGDSHVVLLDVLATKPGPIAEASARYKDLVFMRNGVSHASLSLSQHHASSGPLNVNVAKNYIAQQLSESLMRTGLLLNGGKVKEAKVELKDAMNALNIMNRGLLANDPELINDRRMLHSYAAILESPGFFIAGGGQKAGLSLLLASKLKLISRPIV